MGPTVGRSGRSQLTHDEIERLAQGLHDRYSGGAGPTFEELDELGREANRDAVRFMPTIVVALGYGLRRLPVTASGEGPIRWTAEEVEAAAQLEHLRWARFTRRVGRDDHPDLRPWRLLSEADREKDRANVRDIPAKLGELGLVVLEEDPSR